MKDPIERQDAIDAINAIPDGNWSSKRYVTAIKELPPAQPEIIRCNDCKYQNEGYRRISVKWLPCMDIRVPSNWFCGSAERREE